MHQTEVGGMFLESSERYPPRIIAIDIQPHAIEALQNQLEHHSHRLFCADETQADVSIQDIYRLDEGFSTVQLRSQKELRNYLSMPWRHSRPDPRCRYIFVHAPSSRSSLYITRSMFLDLLTYHHVMPTFLEYVFPFGVQGERRDAYGGSFRSESRLASDEPACTIPTLGRSGRQLEFCYGLQSVERTIHPHRPWAIRPCAVWHTLDLENDRQAWIVVKGNKLIQEVLKTRSERLDLGLDECESYRDRAVSSSLLSHLELARWSVQNWQWYIGTLEEELHKRTARALSTKFTSTVSSTSTTTTGMSLESTACEQDRFTIRKRTSSFSSSRFMLPKPLRKTSTKDNECPEIAEEPQTGMPQQPAFTFEDLQRLQGLEEKANEITMITTSNLQVLRQLRQEYRSLLDTDNNVMATIDTLANSIKRFERKLSGFEAELDVIQSRVHAFGRLLKERKDILYGMLQYKSMTANLDLSRASQNSTLKMESLTEKMHEIAQKTQIETVSMRTITVVTLVFLPGTFISTLMSTPIITFTDGAGLLSDRNISLGALQFYCAVSVPLMAFTFASWYLVYWWEKRKTVTGSEIRGQKC